MNTLEGHGECVGVEMRTWVKGLRDTRSSVPMTPRIKALIALFRMTNDERIAAMRIIVTCENRWYHRYSEQRLKRLAPMIMLACEVWC